MKYIIYQQILLLLCYLTLTSSWDKPTFQAEELWSKTVKTQVGQDIVHSYDKNPYITSFSVQMTKTSDNSENPCTAKPRSLLLFKYDLSKHIEQLGTFQKVYVYDNLAMIITASYQVTIYKLTINKLNPDSEIMFSGNFESILSDPKPNSLSSVQDPILVVSDPDFEFIIILYENQAVYFTYSYTFPKVATFSRFSMDYQRTKVYAALHCRRLLWVAAGTDGIDIYQLQNNNPSGNQFMINLNKANLNLPKPLNIVDVVQDLHFYVYALCLNNGVLVFKSSFDFDKIELLYTIPEGAADSSVLQGTPRKIQVYQNSTLLILRGQSEITEINIDLNSLTHVINKQFMIQENVKSLKIHNNFAVVQTDTRILYFYHSFDYNYTFDHVSGQKNTDQNVQLIYSGTPAVSVDVFQKIADHSGMIGIVTANSVFGYYFEEQAPKIYCQPKEPGEYNYNVNIRSSYCSFNSKIYNPGSVSILQICQQKQVFNCIVSGDNSISDNPAMLILLIILIIVVVGLFIAGGIYFYRKKMKKQQKPSQQKIELTDQRRYKSLDKNANQQQQPGQSNPENDLSHIEVEVQAQESGIVAAPEINTNSNDKQ